MAPLYIFSSIQSALLVAPPLIVIATPSFNFDWYNLGLSWIIGLKAHRCRFESTPFQSLPPSKVDFQL